MPLQDLLSRGLSCCLVVGILVDVFSGAVLKEKFGMMDWVSNLLGFINFVNKNKYVDITLILGIYHWPHR